MKLPSMDPPPTPKHMHTPPHPQPQPSEPELISSKDNASLKAWRRLAHESSAYRLAQRFWIEGEHLCEAALSAGVLIHTGVFTPEAWARSGARWQPHCERIVLLTPSLFASLSALESSAGFGFECALPSHPNINPLANTLVLDRLQDAGNVGTLLRSAAAFGCKQVLALKGTVALWSPKVMRSGMGAHFGLVLMEGLEPQALEALEVPLLATSSHQGEFLHVLAAARALPNPCAWAMGHEGQGLSPSLLSKARMSVRIWQPSGQESLNVAVAASICLYTSATLAAKPSD